VLQRVALFLQAKETPALAQELLPLAPELPSLAAGRAGGEFPQLANLRPDSLFHATQMADLTRQVLDLPCARASLMLAHTIDAYRRLRNGADRFFGHFRGFLSCFVGFFCFLGCLFGLFGFDRGRAHRFMSHLRWLCQRATSAGTKRQDRAKQRRYYAQTSDETRMSYARSRQ
jgi:hypothetical protein